MGAVAVDGERLTDDTGVARLPRLAPRAQGRERQHEVEPSRVLPATRPPGDWCQPLPDGAFEGTGRARHLGMPEAETASLTTDITISTSERSFSRRL